MEIINRNISFAIPSNDMDEEHVANIEEAIVEAVSNLGYTCEIQEIMEVEFEETPKKHSAINERKHLSKEEENWNDD